MTCPMKCREMFSEKLEPEGMREVEVKEHMHVVNRINRVNRKGMGVGNAIVEVTKRMYDILMRVERVYMK